MKKIDRSKVVRDFHQAEWDEPIIFELSTPGERGIVVPSAEQEIAAQVGDVFSAIPDNIKRKSTLELPEISQNRVLRHYTRLSTAVSFPATSRP